MERPFRNLESIFNLHAPYHPTANALTNKDMEMKEEVTIELDSLPPKPTVRTG